MLLNRQSYKVHFLVLFNKAIIIMQNQILYAFEESDCLECDLRLSVMLLNKAKLIHLAVRVQLTDNLNKCIYILY